jgi:hypothetical protein
MATTPFSEIDDVRALCKLPAKERLADAVIDPHLLAAGRELERWIGAYSHFTGIAYDNAVEAECCLAMFFLLPGMNTFYTQGATTLQKELGEMDFTFDKPEDLKIRRDMWYERAERAVAQYRNSLSSSPAMRFLAI